MASPLEAWWWSLEVVAREDERAAGEDTVRLCSGRGVGGESLREAMYIKQFGVVQAKRRRGTCGWCTRATRLYRM